MSFRAGSSRARARRRPASSRRAGNASSAASPMLPATTVASPAARHSAPVSAVTVDLPFEPVTASTFCSGGSARAKSSMSPDELRAVRDRGGNRRMILGHPRTDRHEIRALERRRGERPGGDAHARQRGGELRRERRRWPRVGNPHVRALRGEIARERVPGEPESQHDGASVSSPARPLGFARVERSSQFQRGETEQDEQHRDDPEAHDDLVLLPALELVVVMDRRHPEHALAGQLERGDLDRSRTGSRRRRRRP